MPEPRRQFSLFAAALQLLTRFPITRIEGWQADFPTRACRYFPLVGALVGLVGAGVLLAAARLWAGALPALLAVGAGAWVTGALHEDGLADTADGLGGGRTAAARLAIMKDSRIGVFGALALGLVLAAKTFALAAVPVWSAAAALVASHGAARAAAVVVMRALPYAGDPERAKMRPAGEPVTSAEALAALAFGAVAVLPALLVAPAQTAASVVAASAAAGLVAARVRRLVGGWVGDTLGATEQVFEVSFLLAFAACR